MQYYNQQLGAMIGALVAGQLSPPPSVAAAFKQRRINAVSKALGLTNLFLPIAGSYPIADANSTFTIYTRPLQKDVIVMGCSLMSQDERTPNGLEGEFRVRLPEPLEHLSQNYIFPAQAFSPGAYSIFFPAPFILRASEQIAIDFGFNAPQAGEAPAIQRILIVFFCAAVKDCLGSDEQQILKRAIEVINNTDYQRRIYLNSFTSGSRAVTSQTNSPFFSSIDNMVVYNPQNISSVAVPKGTLTSSETRVSDIPLLVVGLALNSCGEVVRIMDTGSGQSLTQGDFVYSHSLFNPENFVVSTTRGSYFSFWRLPVPHLLRPGATLFTEHLNSTDADQSAFNPEFMMWECLTP